jgi:hypothetical protein
VIKCEPWRVAQGKLELKVPNLAQISMADAPSSRTLQLLVGDRLGGLHPGVPKVRLVETRPGSTEVTIALGAHPQTNCLGRVLVGLIMIDCRSQSFGLMQLENL